MTPEEMRNRIVDTIREWLQAHDSTLTIDAYSDLADRLSVIITAAVAEERERIVQFLRQRAEVGYANFPIKVALFDAATTIESQE